MGSWSLVALLVAGLCGLAPVALAQEPGSVPEVPAPAPAVQVPAVQVPVAPAKLEFDVASIKQNLSVDDRPTSSVPLGPGDRFKPAHGVFSATNQPMWVYLMFAYKMTDHETDVLMRDLPAWAVQEHYDIEAKTERENVTKDELREMVRNLLASRLALKVHPATEEAAVYGLVQAKPGKMGPGLRLHAADDPCSTVRAAVDAGGKQPLTTVSGGFPVVCGGQVSMEPSVDGRLKVGFRNVPLSLIALQMTSMGGLDRPVVDVSEIAGKVDFMVEFAPPTDGDADLGPDFRKALLEQTGLKLVPQKGPVDVIVVDHIERPSAN